MTRLALTAIVIGCFTGCSAAREQQHVQHHDRVDPNAQRVIAAMPGDLRGVAGVNLSKVLESETLSLLLAPLFEDEVIRNILGEAETRCGISFFDDVTRIFMGFGTTGRVTVAALGKFKPRHLAACTRTLMQEHLGDRVTFESRTNGYSAVVSDPQVRIEVVERDGVVMFDVPKMVRDPQGRPSFAAAAPSTGERGSLATNKSLMEVVNKVDTLQAVWLVSSGEASAKFLTEPPVAMWLDASAKSGLDVEVGLRYASGDAAEIGRTALDSMIETFLGSPAKALIKKIRLSVDGPNAILSAQFDRAQTNQLAALLVTAIGG